MSKLTRADYKRIKEVKDYKPKLKGLSEDKPTGGNMGWGGATVEGLIVLGIMVVFGVIGYFLQG